MIFGIIVIIISLALLFSIMFSEYLPKKISIRHIVRLEKVDVYGKPIQYEDYYVICRTTFGLFPRYACVEDNGEILWFRSPLADRFKSYEEAENRLHELSTNPKYWQSPPSV